QRQVHAALSRVCSTVLRFRNWPADRKKPDTAFHPPMLLRFFIGTLVGWDCCERRQIGAKKKQQYAEYLADTEKNVQHARILSHVRMS
ncbi:MAG: hypothetical protein ACTS6J_04640, partial [Burkholderiales bacterium]